jgi:hypothetical protein
LAQRRLEIADERSIGPLAGLGTGDQHVIGPGPPVAGQHFGRGRAQSPLCPVAVHGIPDLSARGEANPHRREAAASRHYRGGLQDKTRSHRPAASRGDPQKISAGLEPYKPIRLRYRDC